MRWYVMYGKYTPIILNIIYMPKMIKIKHYHRLFLFKVMFRYNKWICKLKKKKINKYFNAKYSGSGIEMCFRCNSLFAVSSLWYEFMLCVAFLFTFFFYFKYFCFGSWTFILVSFICFMFVNFFELLGNFECFQF